MELCTQPATDNTGAPLVAIKLGASVAHLSASQAEEVAESINRAATASRYESAIRSFLGKQNWKQEEVTYAIEQIRRLIESRRIQRS